MRSPKWKLVKLKVNLILWNQFSLHAQIASGQSSCVVKNILYHVCLCVCVFETDVVWKGRLGLVETLCELYVCVCWSLRFVGRVQGVVKMQFRKTPRAGQDKVPDNEPSIDIFPHCIFFEARDFSIHSFCCCYCCCWKYMRVFYAIIKFIAPAYKINVLTNKIYTNIQIGDIHVHVAKA